MERKTAVAKLKQLEGKDLAKLAKKYEVTIWKNGKKNKGWAGHTIERYLGIPINSAQAPNFGSWELKLVSLKRLKDGTIKLKETMAITMIDPYNVVNTPFEESHLLAKLQKAVVCARLFETVEDKHSLFVRVATFNLDNVVTYNQVRSDYEEIRDCIATGGFDSLTGRMGVLVQPRTKGAGHGSRSRAFYARKKFVAEMLGL